VVGTATVTTTVVAIDPATRTVTLKNKRARVVVVEVGEEARNFDQIKIGDVVTTEQNTGKRCRRVSRKRAARVPPRSA